MNGRKYYGASTSRQRHDHIHCETRNAAIANFALASEPGAGISPKTVSKWWKSATIEDVMTGPNEPRSSVLSEGDEAIIGGFRRHTLLPQDDCLYAHDPATDAVCSPKKPSAARNLALARCRR